MPITEETWLAALADVPVWLPPLKSTVVISPHPDDETLGTGGLIAFQRRRGLKVSVAAVTDGEAAYPDFFNLAEVRRAEHQSALRELGVPPSDIVRLGLPDGAVASRESDLTAAIQALATSETLLVAPWVYDPHPDHEACGRAAARVAQATGCAVVSYFFWAWHNYDPERLARLSLRKFELDNSLQMIRAAALARHRSQLHREDGRPVLPDELLAPARRSFEIFVVE